MPRVSDLGADATPPLFTVVHGHPSERELAALVAVLTTLPSADAPAPAPRVWGWSSYARAVHAPLTSGPDAWVASVRWP